MKLDTELRAGDIITFTGNGVIIEKSFVALLIEALTPLADAAAVADEYDYRDNVDMCEYGIFSVTCGDLRKASAILARLKAGDRP